MKKTAFAYIVLFSKVFLTVAALLIALAACSNPSGDEGKAFFTINLGSSGRMAWGPSGTGGAYPSFNELKYELIFSSAGKSPQIFKDDLSANGKITGTIDVGTYNVSLKIFLLDDYLYAQDDETHSSVEIIPNGNTPITLHMVKNEYVDGQGLEGNPFRVYDVDTLGRVGKGANPSTWTGDWSLSAHYRQMRDIALTAPVQGGSNLTPIGNDDDPFTGVYDGNGKTISNLIINEPVSDEAVGLFGTTGLDITTNSVAIIKNIGLINCNIIGCNNVGGVVGSSRDSSEVINCYVTGNVSGNENVGGVVGNSGNIVQNCYSTGDVSGYGNVGGVVGSGGIVQKCYSTGDVEGGGSKVGGVAGRVGLMENCYATVDVKGDSQVGGLVGEIQGGLVQNCYATGDVNGTSGHVGGLIGVDMMGKVQNCVALNLNISGGSMYVSGIEGYHESTQINNYWRQNMKVNGSSGDENSSNREEITTTQWSDPDWWTTAGNWDTADNGLIWDFDEIWEWGGSLPILTDMPGRAQDPSVKNN